jgi:hypothetical protein
VKGFFGSMNFARWSILLSLLGSLALVWFGLWQNSQLSEMKAELEGGGAAKLTQQIAQLARKHSQLSDSLKGENLQGEADMQSYIYKIATMDRVEVGNLNVTIPTPEQFSKGIVDKKINVRPDNRERPFARTTIANFLYTLEQQSRRVKVTMITIENANRRVKNHEIPDDKWTFSAEITSRQRSE